MTQTVDDFLIKIKKIRPLILNLNQYFSLELIASGLRSFGALPIMSNSYQEIEELLALSKAVVINLGKLNDQFTQLCNRICEIANKLNKPIILDPIGAGASRYRTEVSTNLIKKHKISVVRGYPSEISALLNERIIEIGTESQENELANENAQLLSEKYNMGVVVSGKINTVIDHDQIHHYNFDSSLLLKVAGINSLLSAIIGAFHAIEGKRFLAAATAVEYFSICVGLARSKLSGPGSFQMNLIDELYLISYNATCKQI